MTIEFEERPSDSPYVALVTRGQTVAEGSAIRPATNYWHMVLRKLDGKLDLLVVGPWTTSGVITYGAGAELLWIRFGLGVFMPHLPTRAWTNAETVLPGAARDAFWLKHSAWQFPSFDNVETFIARLAREDILVQDPVVSAALRDEQPEVADRTVRHRFLQATGLTQAHIRQMRRAEQAADLLARGVSILDTVYEAGYYDQPHLTRALKRFIGHTPAEIVRMSQAACHSVQDDSLQADYHADVLTEAW